MQPTKRAYRKTTLGPNQVENEKAVQKARQEKQRFYEQRRRQELNDSLDGLKAIMLSKFKVTGQSLSSKRAIVDAAIRILELFPEGEIPKNLVRPKPVSLSD
jgi:hypothetical protein